MRRKKKPRPRICPCCRWKNGHLKRKCEVCGTPLEHNKTLGELKADLQVLVNQFVRLRDSQPDGSFICISCGQIKQKDQINAGHYYCVRNYDGLRYDLDNIHAECVRCNGFNDSHLIWYGIKLEQKIGKERLEALHEKAKQFLMNKKAFKFTPPQIREMIFECEEKIAKLRDKNLPLA